MWSSNRAHNHRTCWLRRRSSHSPDAVIRWRCSAICAQRSSRPALVRADVLSTGGDQLGLAGTNK